jgi:hypothetical protein
MHTNGNGDPGGGPATPVEATFNGEVHRAPLVDFFRTALGEPAAVAR